MQQQESVPETMVFGTGTMGKKIPEERLLALKKRLDLLHRKILNGYFLVTQNHRLSEEPPPVLHALLIREIRSDTAGLEFEINKQLQQVCGIVLPLFHVLR
ncbi:MAG: hypothetical protein MUO63_11615 [Desulfobulbaceae bacterium]|nr:hypothetical protein [Desulfobulbaceae bacterium]